MTLKLINGSKDGALPKNIEVEVTSTVGSDYSIYEEFFYATFSSLKKDIFSGDLFVKEDGIWQSIRNQIRVLRSYAQDTDGLIRPHRIEDHLARFAKQFKPELMIDIPQHNESNDYLREICSRVYSTNVTQDELYELILEWGANMWLRFENPTHQNKVLIFQSAQGVGKDYLLRSIFGGLEQFFINFTVSYNERDSLAVLNQGLVINISEFDRTSKMNTGLLKDMITRDSTFVRLPFDRCAVKRPVRCSFVGSCNSKNILTDTTGNRRYVVIEIEKIDRDYPSDRSLEILAQFKAAAHSGYQANQSTVAKMSSYINSITPKAPIDELLGSFDSAVELLEQTTERASGIFQKSEIDAILSDLQLNRKISEKKLLGILAEHGRSHRTSSGMVYGRPGLTIRYREFQKVKE